MTNLTDITNMTDADLDSLLGKIGRASCRERV